MRLITDLSSRLTTLVLVASFCILYTSGYVEYNEPEAKLFLNLAAAAYPTVGNATFREQCISKTFPDDNFEVYAAVATVCDKRNNSCQGFAAVSNVSRTIILSFRGTDGSSQLFQETKASLLDYLPYNETDASGNMTQAGRVNKYFYKAMDRLWGLIVQPLVTQYPGYRFLVTGHSLGGALAALTAFRLSYRGLLREKYSVRLYTFGEPRAGDYDYAMIFQDFVPYAFRVVHWTDPVPHLPPIHDGDPTLSGWPFHHSREIWYNKKFDSYTLCNATYGEDPNCSDRKRFWSMGHKVMSEHLRYFNHYISEYGWNGCSGSSEINFGFSLILFIFYFGYTLV